MNTELIKVKWLRYCSGYAYKPGDIGWVTPGNAEKLLKGVDPNFKPDPNWIRLVVQEDQSPYIMLVDNDYEEPAPVKKNPCSELIAVIWLKSHPGYVQRVGMEGNVTSDDFRILSNEGYVRQVPTAITIRPQ